MADKRQIWAPYESDKSAERSDGFRLPTVTYDTEWQGQGHGQIQQFTHSLPTYDFVAPNVNPFSRYARSGSIIDQHDYTPDAEVSFYNQTRIFDHSNRFYDDSRCSSTDTIMFTSSVSTVYSHSSLELDDQPSNQQGTKRKRTDTEDTKTSKAKKNRHGLVRYRRWPKPPYTYCGMIITSIQLSPKKELTLQGIHSSLMELFPFFRGVYKGWRDSVRHNLSHNQVFYKAMEEQPTKCSHWRVDWSQVTPAMFARQQNKTIKSDEYKRTIHEHLGLPPFSYDSIPADDNISSSTTLKTPTQKKKFNSAKNTPEVCDTHNYDVTLPSVVKCENQENSPLQINTREFIQNRISNVSFEQISPARAPESALISHVVPPSEQISAPNFSHVFDLVVSERRSSVDAVQHLHTLCLPILTSPYQHSQPELGLSTFTCDSDVYNNTTSVKYTSDSTEDMEDDQTPDDPQSPNDQPISHGDSFVTSLIGPETDDNCQTESQIETMSDVTSSPEVCLFLTI